MKRFVVLSAMGLSVALLSSACRTGESTAALKDVPGSVDSNVSAAPVTVVDDSFQPVSPAKLKEFGSNNDGSTMFTYTFTGSPISDLNVAVWVWNTVWGADKPHTATLDDYGNLKGQAGRIPIFDQSATGGRFQIIPNDDDTPPPADAAQTVPDTVAALATTMNIAHVSHLRGKMIDTGKSDPKEMLTAYNAKAHPQAGSTYKIKVAVAGSAIKISKVIATVAQASDMRQFIMGQMSALTNTEAAKLAANEALDKLLAAGCILGFDGAGRDGGGNGEVYLLVLDPSSGRVYSAETYPLEL